MVRWRYAELKDRIDRIASQAEGEGSLKVALSGLNSVRQTLDSLSRLAATSEADVIAPLPDPMDLDGLVERVLQHFDDAPETKEKIALALREVDNEATA